MNLEKEVSLYSRVSTKDQDVKLQLGELRKYVKIDAQRKWFDVVLC